MAKEVRPITYLESDRDTGPRIGGTVPTGLEGEIRSQDVQYFGSFPLPDSDAMEFSVFHSFMVFGESESRDIIDFNNRILTPSEHIWVVVHGESVRGASGARPFEARGLGLGSPSRDVALDDNSAAMPYTESKIGGRAFLERYWLQVDVDVLETTGFQHLLQIGMHGDDFVDGFPWDPSYLHVWAQNPLEPGSYRFMIEQ